MNGPFLFLLAWALGFAAAIPVGPSQIEMAKRALGGHLAAARMVAAGSVSSDACYGVVALFGIAPLLRRPWVMASFDAVGVAVLWTLAIVTLRTSRRTRGRPAAVARSSPGPGAPTPPPAAFASTRWAWITGFSVAMTNPPIILSWLLGFTVAVRLGLASPPTGSTKAIFITGGALGLGCYPVFLGTVLHRFKRLVPPTALARVHYWLGITLFALSFYFAYGVIRFLRAGS